MRFANRGIAETRRLQGPTEPPLGIGPADVHVWLIDLRDAGHSVGRLSELLSGTESERAKSFANPAQRREWIAVRAALRCILALYLNAAPQRLEFVAAPLGKPYVHLSGQRCAIQYSVSHTVGKTLVAVSRDLAVGVDIERISIDSDVMSIARYLNLDMRGANSSCQELKVFYEQWTKIEASVKAQGVGLAYGRKAPPRKDECGSGWTVNSLDLAAEDASQYAAALAVEDSGKTWRQIDASIDFENVEILPLDNGQEQIL